MVASDPEDPTNYYNDANWCDPEYDKLYKQQKVELDPDKRMQQVHEMLTRFYESATYVPLYLQADLQAYRKDKFDGLDARSRPRTGPCCSPTARRATCRSSRRRRRRGRAAAAAAMTAAAAPG